jgi:hypothetical protein
VTDLVTLAGAIADVDSLGKSLNTLLITTVMSLMVSVAVIKTWKSTNSIVAAFMAFVGAAALWFLVMNATVFRDSVGEDLKPSNASTSVVRVVVTGSDDGPVRFGGGR